MPFPIDYNRELRTVALSNVVVGLSGAFCVLRVLSRRVVARPLRCLLTPPPPQPSAANNHAGSGFTGSYIFSQTIFSMRAGVSGWYHGAIIAGLEGAIFLLPFSGSVCWLNTRN
jgi:SulP family sulfate permease